MKRAHLHTARIMPGQMVNLIYNTPNGKELIRLLNGHMLPMSDLAYRETITIKSNTPRKFKLR
jgi:hypothetical protein